MLAVASGNPDLVAFLISKGANVKEVMATRQTALHAAAIRGNTEAARLLVAAGTPVDAVTEGTRRSALHMASAAGATDIARLLLANGATARSARLRWPIRPLCWR